jgi:hypothetical protein
LKFFLAGAFGYWQDVSGYYTSPPYILSTPLLSGTVLEISNYVRLLAFAAKASNRALMLPLFGTVISKEDEQDGNDEELVEQFIGSEGGKFRSHRRYIWSIVDLESLGKTFEIEILEPNYVSHSTSALISLPSPPLYQLTDLHDTAYLDLHPVWLWKYLMERLISPEFEERRHVSVMTDEGPAGFWSKFGTWEIPQDLVMEGDGKKEVKMCENIEKVPVCGSLCRGVVKPKNDDD